MVHGMWDLPGSGIEPVLPALSGRFFMTEPPGKPTMFFFFLSTFNIVMKILSTNLVTCFKDMLLLIYIIMAYI